MHAVPRDLSPPRRRARIASGGDSNRTAAEQLASPLLPAAAERNSSAAAAPARPRLNVALETDIGHDCDDLQALIVALKDHISGVVRIVYISTVSQANVQRAQLVQWLCGRMGVSDIPIVPSRREVACVGNRPLNNCVDVWQFALNEEGTEYKQHGSVTLEDVLPPRGYRAPVAEPELSVVTKQRLLREAGAPTSIVILGPGVEPETFDGLDPALIRSVVWQGNKLDKDSFNVKCDMESAVAVTAWCAKHRVASYHVGKLTARATRMSRGQFLQLQASVPEGVDLDLRKVLQLGVMEFRDAARNMFNCINFAVSSPGHARLDFVPACETFDESNPRHAALREVLEAPSTRVVWFDGMTHLTPLYDVTAYLLCRDTQPGSLDSPWYRVSLCDTCPAAEADRRRSGDAGDAGAGAGEARGAAEGGGGAAGGGERDAVERDGRNRRGSGNRSGSTGASGGHGEPARATGSGECGEAGGADAAGGCRSGNDISRGSDAAAAAAAAAGRPTTPTRSNSTRTKADVAAVAVAPSPLPTTPAPTFFAVGQAASDVRDPATYTHRVFLELQQGIALMREPR